MAKKKIVSGNRSARVRIRKGHKVLVVSSSSSEIGKRRKSKTPSSHRRYKSGKKNFDK